MTVFCDKVFDLVEGNVGFFKFLVFVLQFEQFYMNIVLLQAFSAHIQEFFEVVDLEIMHKITSLMSF